MEGKQGGIRPLTFQIAVTKRTEFQIPYGIRQVNDRLRKLGIEYFLRGFRRKSVFSQEGGDGVKVRELT